MTRTKLRPLLVLTLASLSPLAAQAAQDTSEVLLIHRQCALCHGAWYQGTLGGKYPRVAGMNEKYLIKVLQRYKSGKGDHFAMTVVGG